MTNDNDRKLSPSGIPVAVEELATKVHRAIQELDAEQDVIVRMTVSGGVEGERYDFHFTASSKGVESGLQDQFSDRDYGSRDYKAPQEAFDQVLETVNVRELAMAKEQEFLFPPDSLVGQLLISGGDQVIRTVFMADPDQAETAGYEMPPYLEKTIDTVYDLAAKMMDVEDVRP